MDAARAGSGDLDAIDASTGTKAPRAEGKGCTLTSGKIYYVPFGTFRAITPSQTPWAAVQAYWGVAFAGVITLESCLFPDLLGGEVIGQPDITDWDVIVGHWIQQSPPDSYVPTAGANTTSNLTTVTATAGALGGCEYDPSGFGARRLRLKLNVTTGDVVRLNGHGKLGG